MTPVPREKLDELLAATFGAATQAAAEAKAAHQLLSEAIKLAASRGMKRAEMCAGMGLEPVDSMYFDTWRKGPRFRKTDLDRWASGPPVGSPMAEIGECLAIMQDIYACDELAGGRVSIIEGHPVQYRSAADLRQNTITTGWCPGADTPHPECRDHHGAGVRVLTVEQIEAELERHGWTPRTYNGWKIFTSPNDQTWEYTVDRGGMVRHENGRSVPGTRYPRSLAEVRSEIGVWHTLVLGDGPEAFRSPCSGDMVDGKCVSCLNGHDR